MSDFDTSKWFKTQYINRLNEDNSRLGMGLRNSVSERSKSYKDGVKRLIGLKEHVMEELGNILANIENGWAYDKGLLSRFIQDLTDDMEDGIDYEEMPVDEMNDAELNINTTGTDPGSGDADNPTGEELEANGGGYNE